MKQVYRTPVRRYLVETARTDLDGNIYRWSPHFSYSSLRKAKREAKFLEKVWRFTRIIDTQKEGD